MKYTNEVYEIIRIKRPSLINEVIDAMSASYIMATVKDVDYDAYMRIFRNK